MPAPRPTHRPVKIALTGSHGTGKTTLISELQRRLAKKNLVIEIVSEIPRLVCEAVGNAKFFRQGENTLAKQTLLLQSQIQAEYAAAASSPDVILCDRALLDHWIYTKHFHTPSLEENAVRQAYEATIVSHCKTYDLILYLPVEFGVIDDGVREDDSAFQAAIDIGIKHFLDQQNLDFAVLNGSVDDRAATAISAIEKMGVPARAIERVAEMKSTRIGIVTDVADAEAAYRAALADVLATQHEVIGGETKSVGSGKQSKEVLHYSLIIANSRERLVRNATRKLNLPAAVARFIWMMAGNDRLKDIEFYEKKVAAFSDDGIVVPGSSYGRRMVYAAPGCNQIAGALSRLKEDPATRRAAVSVFHPQDVTRDSKDIPCTFGLFFHNRGEFLVPSVIMRSNNAFLLLPYNLFEFSLLGEVMAAEMGLKLGPMYYSAASMHVYASDYAKAEEIIRTPDSGRTAPMPVMPSDPLPMAQIQELVKIEADVRYAASGFSSQNFESKWLSFADSRLDAYWRQLYYVLLFAACKHVGFEAGATRLKEFIDEPWLSSLPPDTQERRTRETERQADLFSQSETTKGSKKPTSGGLKQPDRTEIAVEYRADSTIITRAQLEKELDRVLHLYQPHVAKDQWSRVVEYQPIFLQRATTSADQTAKVFSRLQSLRFPLGIGEKVEFNRARADVIIRSLDKLTAD